MQKQLNRLTYKCRRLVRKKLLSTPVIYKFTKKLHRTYCTLTGFLHVLPDFYIIGTQKGGTSSLYGYLVEHTSIQPCYSKEPSYFDRYFDRGLDWYKVNFPFKIHRFIVTKILQKKFITGEASVRYLDHPYAAERIREVTPNAKFIILLRNPITRAFSHHTRVRNNNRESLTFKDAFLNESKRTKEDYNKIFSDPFYYADSYFTYSYFERGIYVDKIKHWMEVFPKEQFLIIQSEEFFSDPSKIYNQVLDFLGVENFELGMYRTYGKVNKNRKIDSVFYNELLDYFKPHNQRLYEFLGRRFDWEEEIVR